MATEANDDEQLETFGATNFTKAVNGMCAVTRAYVKKTTGRDLTNAEVVNMEIEAAEVIRKFVGEHCEVGTLCES